MSINTRAMFQNMGQSLSNLGQGMVSSEIEARRQANMAKYRSIEQDNAHTNALDIQTRGFEYDAEKTVELGDAKLGAAQIKAKADAEAAALAHKRKQENIVLKGKVDPSASNISLEKKEESEYSKTVGKERAKHDVAREADAEAAVMAANEMDADLSIMEEIIANAGTGLSDELLGRAGRLFGTDKSAAMQAFNASSSTLVLELAGKLSGVISDRDMITIENAAPGFGKDPRANKIIIGKLRGAMNRSRQNYSSMMEWKDDKGDLRGWRPPNVMNASKAAQESVNAAENPSEAISPMRSEFDKWKAGKQ